MDFDFTFFSLLISFVTCYHNYIRKIHWKQIVGHVIRSDGLAYSGGQSATGETAPGHHMEITMLQLYKVSLSAGKAHRDHKHHHAHHFDHDGLITTPQPPTPAPTDVCYYFGAIMAFLNFSSLSLQIVFFFTSK